MGRGARCGGGLADGVWALLVGEVLDISGGQELDSGAFGERFVKEHAGVEATLPNEIHAQPIRGVTGLGQRVGSWVSAPEVIRGAGFWVIRGQIRHELSR